MFEVYITTLMWHLQRITHSLYITRILSSNCKCNPYASTKKLGKYLTKCVVANVIFGHHSNISNVANVIFGHNSNISNVANVI